MRCFSVIFFTQFSTLFVFSEASWENTLVLDAIESNPNKTLVVAILPLRLSLCKLASIAEGTTKDQLLKTLDDKKDTKVGSFYSSVSEMLNKLKQKDLILLNKIYVNYSSEVNSLFLANSTNSFGVSVESVGLNTPRSALAYINNGIASATYRRIRDIIEMKDITDQTKMMMIIAAHLKVTWEVPFDVRQTKPRRFIHHDGKASDIPMMIQEEGYQVFENSAYKVLRTQLRSPRVSFTLIVPNQSNGLPGVLDRMRFNPNLMKEARAGMTIQFRKLVMPRLKIKSYLDLTDIFKKSSVSNILNSSSSDLDKILKEEFRNSSNMFISKIKQNLFLEVDELGVDRREISADDQKMNGPPPRPQIMREVAADRPFFFTLDLEECIPSKEKLTIVPHRLFSGVYYGPK